MSKYDWLDEILVAFGKGYWHTESNMHANVISPAEAQTTIGCITSDAKQDLIGRIEPLVVDARIHELKRLREFWGQSYDETLGGKFNFVALADIDKRLAELTDQKDVSA